MRPAFTLIELLVVITIIVVLLALLTPALDKAIYQADLAVCGATQRAAGSSVVSAALDYKRLYPNRTAGPVQPNQISNGQDDQRDQLRQYVGDLNKFLIDPLTDPVDLEGSDAATRVYSSYALWFGWRFDKDQGGPGMRRLGDRWTWRGDTYNVLLQDRHAVNAPDVENGSHPDRDGVLAPRNLQDESEGNVVKTATTWSGPALRRGFVDLNFTYEDLSVTRLDGVAWFDDRIGPPDDRFVLVSDRRNTNAAAPMGITPRN